MGSTCVICQENVDNDPPNKEDVAKDVDGIGESVDINFEGQGMSQEENTLEEENERFNEEQEVGIPVTVCHETLGVGFDGLERVLREAKPDVCFIFAAGAFLFFCCIKKMVLKMSRYRVLELLSKALEFAVVDRLPAVGLEDGIMRKANVVDAEDL
jgi:hypothetical protein